jgi:hypothetical protein
MLSEPAGPETGGLSGSDGPQKRSEQEPGKNWLNWRGTGKNRKTGGSATEPVLKFYLIFLIEKIKKIHKLNGNYLIPPKVTLNDDQSSGRLQVH